MMIKVHPIRCLRACAFYLQLHKLFRYFHREKIIVLMYHGFSDEKNNGAIEDNQGLFLDIKKFRQQLAYLKKYYNIISLSRVIEHYNKGVKLPPNPVVITIDDGYRASYSLVYPALKEFNAPAAIFLTTDFVNKKDMLWHDRVEYAVCMTKSGTFNLDIDRHRLCLDFRSDDLKKMHCREIIERLKLMPQESRDHVIERLEQGLGQKMFSNNNVPKRYQPLEWDEALEMIKSGIISIGSHTCSHIILTRSSPERQKAELILSKQLIESKTGLNCGLFCYPNGAAGDFDSDTRQLLKETGYLCGLTAVEGVNDRHSDVFELKRLAIDSREDLISFITTLSRLRI